MAFPELRPRNADSDNNLLFKIADSLAISIGARGHDLYSGATGAVTGTWQVLHAISASVVTIIRDGSTETITLAAGDRVYGRITSFSSASGDVELYRAV